ncbi:DUF6049 family protein [Ornithinimicrobium pekingense]|uniref:Secreted protein n=1 Tax=Ornithinimicrobium pekingense TaxID=384677 RepID=A0ABQ2FA86_9MICO|nr:DUF6049 family protein [Ornithinimicrobium pekingense]GGK73668.1 hypothetical protein GCM10011509_22870 [Ornithinimicrobium pekingense]
MIRSARRSAWAVRPRAAAATAGVVATLSTALAALPVVPAQGGVPVPGASPAAAPSSALPGSGTDDEPDEPTEQGLDGTVRVVLDEVEPTVPHVGEPVTLRGRIVNDSPGQRRLSTVTVRAAWSPLTSRADVTHWLEGRDQRETGWVLGEDAVGPVVVPGASVPFTVEVPEWGLNAVPGDLAALALQIEASGEPPAEAGSGGTATAPPAEPVVLRTVLAAARTHAVADPLDVTWVVPLTLPADPALTSRDDQDRHTAWSEATGPGSPARTWLESLTLPSVTWMVDPALLVPVDPADELVEAAPEPGGPDPADPDDPTQGPDGRPPPDDDGTTSTAPPDDAAVTTDAPEEETAAPGADGSTSTEAPTGQDPGDGTDGSAATAPGDGGEDEGLDKGQELGGAAGPADPVTAADVEDGLVALRGLLARSAAEQLWWTPTADPDVAALLAQQADPATVRTAMHLPLPQSPAQVRRLLQRGRSDVAWPALSAPTTQQVTALDRLWATRPATPEGVAAVVVPRESLSGGSNTSVGAAARPVEGASDVVALGADTRAAALLAGAASDTAELGQGAVTQRLLADSLTAYQQDPLAGRSMLYAPPRGAQVPGGVLDALTEGFETAPWARAVSASDLLAAAAGTSAAPLSGVAPAPEVLGRTLVERVEPGPSPLGARQLRSLARLQTSLAGLSEILGDTSVLRTWEPVLGHLWSTRWRGDAEPWADAWQSARRPVARVQEAVHVNPSTVNFLSDQGIMQVTVVNDLPVAVEGVRVEVLPDRSLLRIVQQPEPISIGARSRATVSFTARAVTRGVTTVNARLTTPNGTVLGDDAQVSVRVQPTGVWIYWVLGSIAGLVLVLGLVRARRTAPRSAVVAASSTPTAEENR